MAAPQEVDFSRTNIRWSMERAAQDMVTGTTVAVSGVKGNEGASLSLQGCLKSIASPSRRPLSPPRLGRMGAPIGGLGMSQRLAGSLMAARSAPTLPPLQHSTSAPSQAANQLPASLASHSDRSHEELSQLFNTVDHLIQEAKVGRRPEEDLREKMAAVEDKTREALKRKRKKEPKKYGPAMSLELKLRERRAAMNEKASATITDGFGMVANIPMCEHQVQGRKGNETYNLVNVMALRQSCKVPMDESAANKSVKNLLEQRERQERARKLEQEQARARKALLAFERRLERAASTPSASPTHSQRYF